MSYPFKSAARESAAQTWQDQGFNELLFTFDSPAAGIMSQTGNGPGEWFIDGATAAGELSSAAGWAVELRRDNMLFGGHGNHIRIQDDDGYIGIINYASGIEIYNGANQYYDTDGSISGIGFFPLSPGFHTVRLERAPNSATVAFTIDGGTNGSIDVDATLTSFWDLAAPAFYWGNTNLARAGAVADVQWDYVNLVQLATPLDGDLNGDGFVGQDDLNIVLGDWGNMPPGDPRAETSGDGFVGQDDLHPVLADWGQGTPPVTLAGSSLSAAAVPEPSSLALAMLAFGMICGYRRRKGAIPPDPFCVSAIG